MVGPKFDPKKWADYVHNFVKFKRNQWRVNVNVTNFMLQQRIFITKIAIPISAEDSFQTRIVLKEKSEILFHHF